MRLDIISSVPNLLLSFLNYSIIKRAQDKKLVEIYIHNLHLYSKNKHKKTDDYAFGGGPGMVMQIEPIVLCIESLIQKRKYDEIIYLTPDGDLLMQNTSNQLSLLKNIILLCGHYKGIDERIREHYITKEISIGDYVLTGGELAAAVLTDSIVRLLPGVLSDETSALNDSFQNGLIDSPLYTRPADFRGLKVPNVLLSGNAKEIEKWQFEKSISNTLARRPSLLKNPKNTKN